MSTCRSHLRLPAPASVHAAWECSRLCPCKEFLWPCQEVRLFVFWLGRLSPASSRPASPQASFPGAESTASPGRAHQVRPGHSRIPGPEAPPVRHAVPSLPRFLLLPHGPLPAAQAAEPFSRSIRQRSLSRSGTERACQQHGGRLGYQWKGAPKRLTGLLQSHDDMFTINKSRG